MRHPGHVCPAPPPARFSLLSMLLLCPAPKLKLPTAFCVLLFCLCVRLDGLTFQGRPDPTESLTINPGADVSDPRKKHAGVAGPTPSSVRHPSRDFVPSDVVAGPSASHQELGVSMDSTYTEVNWMNVSAV